MRSLFAMKKHLLQVPAELESLLEKREEQQRRAKQRRCGTERRDDQQAAPTAAPAPEQPAMRPFHVSITLLPNGVIAPIPVITTRSCFGRSFGLSFESGRCESPPSLE